jgi:hypothetical protein
VAEEQVGGISVSFTADAAQLQQQIQRLEQQLKQFDAAYGRQKVQLQVQAPPNRQLLDTRREISNAFTARGSAGQIMAKVQVQAPDARALGQFRNQLKSDIGTVPIKVVGNFEWGQRPPSSITIPVTGGGGGRGTGGSSAAPTGGQPTPLAGQRPARPRAAAPTPGVGNVTTAGSQAVQRTRSTRPASTRVTKEDLAAEWTQDDLTPMTDAAIRAQMTGATAAEKKLFQGELDRRAIAKVSQAGQRPAARGFLTDGPVPRPTPVAKIPQGISRTVKARPGESLATTLQQTAIKSSVPPAAAVSRARLESLSRQLTAGSRARGEKWYPEANKALKRLRSAYGLEGRINDAQLSSIGGLFSANAEWPANLRLVAGFFDRMAKGGMANEDFLGIGTFVDPIVKAAQIARMNNPTLRQIAERTDVQTGEEWLANKPGTGRFFGEKTGAFTGALHAGGGRQAEAEARAVFRSLTPMDRWMSRGIHGIENVGPMAHFQGQNVMSAAWKRHGFSSDFAYQAGLWDLIGPANAEAEPFGGKAATPFPAAFAPRPTRESILADRERAAREKAAGRRILERQAVVMPMAAEPRSARGFGMGDDFDPFGRQAARQPQTGFMRGRAMGTVPAMGGMVDLPRQAEDAAKQSLLIKQMQTRMSAGGFTFDPTTGKFLEPKRGRTGPFLAASGQSVSGTDLQQLMRQLRGIPANARELATGGMIGGWQNPETGAIDLDVSRAFGSKRAMLQHLATRPDQMAGFALGAGQDIPNPAYQAPGPRLTLAQLEQRRAAGRSSYAKLVAEGRAGPGIRGILPRGFPIRQQPRMPMAADLPWDENGNLGVEASEYGYASPAFGLMSEEEARLDAPVAGGKGGRGKQLPGGLRRARVSPAAIAETVEFDENIRQAIAAQQQFQQRQLSAARRTSTRSVPTFLAGIISGQAGGVEAAELQKEATVAVNAHKSALKELKVAQTEENEIAKKMDLEKPGSEAHKALTARLDEATTKVKDLTAAEKDLRTQADEMTRSANKAAGTGLRNLAAGFVANLAAGVAFGAGFTALQGVIEGVSQGLAPTIARLTDFSEAAGETSKNLAALTRAAGGRPEVGVAQAFAQAGFKGPVAERLRPELTQVAEIQAGLAAFKEQQALIQTAFNFRNGNGIPGITASTGGGLFGIGAEKGLLETLKEQIQTFTPERAGGGAVARGGRTIFAPGVDATVVERNAETLEHLNNLLGSFGVAIETATEAGADLAQQQQQAADILKLGGPQAQGFAESLQERGLVLTDQEGQLLQGDELKTAITVGLKDASKQSAKELLNGMRPQIEAQKALFRLQSDFQRDQLNPAQFALQLAANPLTRQGGFGERPTNVATGKQVPIPAIFRGAFNQPGGGGAVGAQFTAAFEALSPMVDEADARIKELAADGQRALEALVPADQIVEFRALNKEIAQVGSQIAGLQLGVQQEQLNLQVAQYNNQLRIATRSQTDLLQLTGQIGATGGDNLGLLQRQQIMYERQTQELSLQSNELTLQSNTLSIILAQRQINFQRSLAGFVTPGETPQEIAARAREAELEANFAQKQLNIQKEQLKIAREQQGIATQALPLQFKIQDIGFQRQLTDINAEIALLNQGVTVAVHTAAAERAIAHLTALENELVKKAGTYVEEGAKFANGMMETFAQLKVATQEATGELIQQSARAWNIVVRQGIEASQYLIGALNSGGGVAPPGGGAIGTDEAFGGPQPTFGASGLMGMTLGPTGFVAGEAGGEAVAILKNPRTGSWGGSNTAPINIMVTGNTIGGSEQDQERFAAIIAKKVEEIQSRRGSLLGLRSV